jgi:hypothetical protein
MKKRNNTDLLRFYLVGGTLRNTKPVVPSLDTIWRTWQRGMSVLPSLENLHHQKLHLFQFGIYRAFHKVLRDYKHL